MQRNPPRHRAYLALVLLSTIASVIACGGNEHAGESSASTLLAEDEFTDGTAHWVQELVAGGPVTAADGVLNIDVPDGATVWFKDKLTAPYELQFTATPVSAGGANDRVSDLNMFWNATDPNNPEDIFATVRSGHLDEYNALNAYYVGYGANGNSTTRLRRYIGEADERPLIYDYRAPLLEANEPVRVRIVSQGDKVQFWADDALVFDYTDPQPYTSGWFAFRTVTSHFRITDFRVTRAEP